ncbi:MAG: HlyD family efflux transporter periplasmic adaptor subunit [Prevotellaceae bacterium]|jgi:HlyD family secretion protein|nr:HlyD family efflux transporter periplasmic adaptor subunit [Prevotellaceae bacterium]
MKSTAISILLVVLAFTSCNRNKLSYDAAGTFEAVEILISSEASGIIEQLDIEEGARLEAGTTVGYVDSTQLYLKKLQLLSSRKALQISRPDINAQIAATREEIARIKTEKNRIENLLKGDAVTQQRLDEINALLKVTEGKLAAQMNSLQTNIGNINEQSTTVAIQVAQLDDQLAKCRIINPIRGTVLKKYAEVFELTSPARPLYKIADMQTLYLRAYVTSDLLTKLQLGQNATVYSDFGESEHREYAGKVIWISDKAEFTPKTIQTKDERANLVYAVKIAVKNDGYLKIGMYGEVSFN